MWYLAQPGAALRAYSLTGLKPPKNHLFPLRKCAWASRPLPQPVKAASDKGTASTAGVEFSTTWLAQQSWWMALSSAVLGPLCDGQHSSHDVLHYEDPWHLVVPGLFHLETCWWVPLLFSVAGIILGVSHPWLDSQPWADRPRGGSDPSWPWVLLAISLFVAQYWASGALEEPLLGQALGPLPAIDVILLLTGVAHWWWFDGTRQGLGMALLTAVGGPLIEIALIKALHLYHYEHPAIWGIPTWIPWVYFCGAAAVGNLGRKVSASFKGS